MSAGLPRVALFSLFCALALPFPTAAQTSGGPPGGNITDFLVLDAERGRVYVSADAGVFRSNDGGASWEPFSEGLPFLPVTAVVGRAGQLFVSLDGGGVWRSRNGEAWESVSDGIGDLQVLSLANDPRNPQILFAGTRNDGVFFSNNGGDGWIRAGTGLTAGAYLTIEFDPSNSQRLFAGNANGFLFESVDGGQVWQSQAAGFAAFRRVSFDPADTNIVYVATTAGLVRRPGGGQPFGIVQTLPQITVLDVLVDPADSNVIYAPTLELGLTRSRDGGATWAQTGAGLPATLLFALAALPGDSGTHLLGGAGGSGVFSSDDQGSNWTLSSTNLHGATVLAIAADPRNSGVVVAATEGGGLFRSANGGDTWTESRTGMRLFSPSQLKFDPANSDTLYVGSVSLFDSFRGALGRSGDGGRTWASIATGLPVYSIAPHPSDQSTVWVGTSSGRAPLSFPMDPLWCLDGRGDSVRTFSGDSFELLSSEIFEVALDPSNPRNLYLAGFNPFRGYEFWRSDNAGGDFRIRARTTRAMSALEVDPTNPERIFLGLSSVSADGGVVNGSILRSTNRGGDFEASDSGLPDNEIVNVTSIVTHPLNGHVYASTGSAVYKSTDAGSTWQRASTGLENLAIRSLSVDPAGTGVVYAATSFTGVYKTLDGGDSWNPTAAVRIAISAEGVVNGADFLGGGVAPGMIATIFGAAIGPSLGVGAELGSDGKLPTTLAGVRVFFNDIPAPLFFVNSTQANCQVPFEIAGLPNVTVRVEFGGNVSNTVTVRVVEAKTGIFNAALNQDFSVNTAETPEAPGRAVQLFVTGQGMVTPGLMTGATAPFSSFPVPNLPVRVEIDGREARVLFAGLAPGFVGLLQINVVLPPASDPGERNVVVTIGSSVSPRAGKIYVAE